MIVQITLVRNELTLIKELLPVWKNYADGFVFLLDRCTDNTLQYLNENKEKYNILEILEHNPTEENLIIETDVRQLLFDTAFKYSNKIICLDADEYLDGEMSKRELDTLLTQSTDTILYLQWIQYTSCNTIRVDGPWRTNFKDRIGCYSKSTQFQHAQMHSTHLPIPKNQLALDPNKLFIVHMQWINKTFVAIKQYFWKVTDYVNNKVYGVGVAGNEAYDASVNNFNWEEEYTHNLLKVNPLIFEKTAIYNNYRLTYIREQTKLHNIPDLGSWGYNFISMDETKQPIINPYKISVITAIGPINVYGKFILRYLENLTDQHFFNQTEHIIVYSEWHELFHEFLKYPNFILIKEDERKGVYNAWNIGIKAATTEYVTNWNIDDLRHPINNKIKYDAITQNNYDVIYNWYIATSDENENFYNLDISTKTFLQYPDNYENYVLHNCYAGPDPLWKKSLHDIVGYFDYENFNTIGDWEMWIRFANANAKFKLIPQPLCLYLEHKDTVSQRNSHKVEAEKQKLRIKYITV